MAGSSWRLNSHQPGFTGLFKETSMANASAEKTGKMTSSKSNASTGPTKKTSRAGKTRTVSKDKPTPDVRIRRANTVAHKSATKVQSSAKSNKRNEQGLVDLLEHGLKDIYYAEKKIYRTLPKMIKGAEDEQLVEALTAHREETAGQIETLEKVFDAIGLRAKGEKCEAIDGILEESQSILDDFGGTFAGDAAIIFSAQAVEHYEIARYTSMVGFADALGLDDVREMLNGILGQETSAHTKLNEMAEGFINEAASEYDEDEHNDNANQDAMSDC
jgi:ferritin-like metal-binding protein YciE